MAAQPSTEQQQQQPLPEPLKYQRWVLKVPIHCEGCKRKVKKVLHSIEGVYKIAIEPKQHKVTVTGDVAADTLVKKLIKEGKHAELWPEEEKKQGEGKKKKKKKKNKKKKENESKSSEEDAASESTEKEDDEEEETEQNPVKISEGGAVTLKLNAGKPESKNTVNVTEISQNGNQSSFRVDTKGSGGDVSAENKASSGKKKKKKGHKGNPPPNEVHVSVGPPPGITGYIPLPGQVNLNPPIQQFYPYPAYEPPSYGRPMYAASYNTSYPTAHHAGLYQMGPPPPYANAYVFTDELYTPSQPLDLIGDAYAEEDEEGSGCSIM